MMAEMEQEELQALYAWIDEIPLSRAKKNITRDFSDGVLAAEVVHHFLPKMVEMHNYSPANSTSQKVDNWRTLNRKVLSQFNFNVPDDLLQSVASSKPGTIEFILSNLRSKIEKFLENRVHRPGSSDYPSEFGSEPQMDVYNGGPLYDPHQLLYAAREQYNVYNPQEMQRHPAPPQVQDVSPASTTYPPQHHRQGMGHPQPLKNHQVLPVQHPVPKRPVEESGFHPLQKQQAHTLPLHSKIPVKNKQIDIHNNPLSGPVLPPVNHGGITNAPRMLANPEKLRPKATKYSKNTRNPPVALGKQRESSAGVRLRIAEKDQRILESQECIQFLQMKVTRLEHLVQIKDMKISELKQQIELTKHHPLQRR